MLIRCYGARGSIAVSGPEYLRYGGNTTCLELRTDKDSIIAVDAGSGLRALGNRLVAEGRRRLTMFFTHSHWDHILGFPFFKPIYREDSEIDIYGCPLEQGSMQTLLARTMAPPYFPVPFRDLAATVRYHEHCDATRVDDLTVTTIPLSHPNLGVGYKFEEGGRSFVFLTDNELNHPHRGGRSFEEYVAFCRDADLLIHDAEYTAEDYRRTRGWGHSLYTDALELALAAGVGRLGLFHHNQDRPDEGIDAMVADCRRLAAARGRPDLDCFGVTQSQELIP